MAEACRSGYTGRQAVEKEAIWMEVFRLLQSCPASPKCIQLWRSKVITIIRENVCAVNSLGDSHAEAHETLVLRGGDAWANMGTLSRSLRCHLLVKMFPLRSASDSPGQQLHPQPQFFTSDGKFQPVPFSTYKLRTKMRQVQVQNHFYHRSGTCPTPFPSLEAQADVAIPSVARYYTPNQHLAFHWQEQEAKGCGVCLHHLVIHHKVIVLP